MTSCGGWWREQDRARTGQGTAGLRPGPRDRRPSPGRCPGPRTRGQPLVAPIRLPPRPSRPFRFAPRLRSAPAETPMGPRWGPTRGVQAEPGTAAPGCLPRHLPVGAAGGSPGHQGWWPIVRGVGWTSTSDTSGQRAASSARAARPRATPTVGVPDPFGTCVRGQEPLALNDAPASGSRPRAVRRSAVARRAEAAGHSQHQRQGRMWALRSLIRPLQTPARPGP